MATAPRTRKGPGSSWLAAQGWKAFPFQREVAKAIAAGESGLLHATTGSGKTYAVWLAALDAFVAPKPITAKGLPSKRKQAPPPLTVLWLTPMRALAADTLRALERPVLDEELEWTLGLRTGDTGSSERARQNRRLPTALVTTPESLSLLLSREDAQEALGQVRLVVIDEWHELLGNKRGTQTQLALARLRRWNPGLQTWGLSATLGNQADLRASLARVGVPVLWVNGGNDPAYTAIGAAACAALPESRHLAVPGAQAVGVRDVDLVQKLLIDRRDEAFALQLYESPDQGRIGMVQDGFDPALASAPGRAGDAGDDLVAVERRAHRPLANIEVAGRALALVIGHDESVPRASAAQRAYEREFLTGRAELVRTHGVLAQMRSVPRSDRARSARQSLAFARAPRQAPIPTSAAATTPH